MSERKEEFISHILATEPATSAQTVTADDHSPLPWVIPAGKQNGFIICSGDDPAKPGPILMIVTKPKGRSYVLTDSDIADNTALMVKAVMTHATLTSSLAAALARIGELEKALADKICDREELPDELTPPAIDQIFARDDLYTARAVFARLRNFGYRFSRAALSQTEEGR